MKTKKIAIILVSLLMMLCVHCQKEKTPLPKPQADKTQNKKAPQDNNGKKIILEINDMKLSNDDLKQFLQLQYPDIFNPTETPAKEANTKILSRLFDSYAEHSIVLYFANQHDIPVDTKELDDYISRLSLPGNIIDKASVIDIIKVHKYLYTKVYEAVDVSESEIRDYYNLHLEDFRKKAEVFLYQILVNNKETAVKIRAQLDNNPQKFEDIAKQESVSMEASKGGEMGYFEEGILPKDMEQVVFSLNPGSISPVVESSYGFHIFKITQKKQGRLLYLDKVREEIRQKLLSEKLRIAYQEFLKEASHEVAIKYKFENLYFDYQTIKGDTGDENKETNDTNPVGNAAN